VFAVAQVLVLIAEGLPVALQVHAHEGAELQEARIDAPVVTRLQTYDVRPSDKACADYCVQIMAMPELQQWIAAAQLEPEDIDELEMEF